MNRYYSVTFWKEDEHTLFFELMYYESEDRYPASIRPTSTPLFSSDVVTPIPNTNLALQLAPHTYALANIELFLNRTVRHSARFYAIEPYLNLVAEYIDFTNKLAEKISLNTHFLTRLATLPLNATIATKLQKHNDRDILLNLERDSGPSVPFQL